MTKIPNRGRWAQSNRSDTAGSLHESFNIDLSTNPGRIRTTRTKRVEWTGNNAEFIDVAAIKRFSNDIYIGAQGTTSHEVWVGTNTPFDGFTRDTSSININPLNADTEVFNGGLYAVSGTTISKTTDGATWSSVDTSLTNSSPHLLLVFEPDGNGERLYVVDDTYQVNSVNTSDTLATVGNSYTLNTNLADYNIKVFMAGTNSIWAGLSSGSNGRDSVMVEWDGVTANTPTNKYVIEARVMAGVIKDNVPYVVDSLGRLLVFTGGAFIEVDRFPLKGGTFLGASNNGNNDRAIHPRGMAVDGDEILICVVNRTDSITSDDFNDFPSGVWAWSNDTGLYHKYSPSYQAVADTGTTNLTDHGQFRCHSAGPLAVIEAATKGGETVADNGGRVLFGMEYYLDADDTNSDTEWGVFSDDTRDNTQKGGWIVTPKIDATQFLEMWERVGVLLSELTTSGDRCVLKYRIDDTELVTTATWDGTDGFIPADELTSFENGDEATIIQGTGGGACENSKYITSGSGSFVRLKNAITGVSGTSKVRMAKWRDIQDIQNTGKNQDMVTIGEKAQWIQFKVYMQWTGAQELYSLFIENSSA